ncbi:MAG: ArsR/SmtB family transcription factor [Gammaproteobacteria bacterium]
MPNFEKENLLAAADGLRAIAHPLRLAILCELSEGPRNVSELLAVTEVSQPNLSQHLAKLRMLGILQCERRSQHIYYRLADPAFMGIVNALKSVYCPHEGTQPRKETEA